MYFYEVKSKLVDLCDSDAYVMSNGTYIMKKNIEENIKSKKSAVAMNNLLIKAEQKVKEIQHIEKLRKHRNDPYVNALLQEYDSLKDKSDETGISNDEII